MCFLPSWIQSSLLIFTLLLLLLPEYTKSLSLVVEPKTSVALHHQNPPPSVPFILKPNQSFPPTVPGQISIVSFNLLAPLYNSFQIEDLQQREEFATTDRATRLPLSIQRAQQTNADILCLQEVEKGSSIPQLLLADKDGYDGYFWSPLLPTKTDHSVGLAFAWRTQKHTLVATHSFPRGVVAQFQETTGTTETLTIGNVHLPARPRNILGRLYGMSQTIQALTTLNSKHPHSGTCIVCGDLNGDPESLAAQLLTKGRVPYGNLLEQGQRANLSKKAARQMQHPYTFRDVYQDIRSEHAPVTVSLKGYPPSCMDHLFVSSNVKVQSILATLNDPRLDLPRIYEGLPNVSAGYPSDHIPIGALLLVLPKNDRQTPTQPPFQSLSYRQQHTQIVRRVAEWLQSLSDSHELCQNQPLYKCPWTKRVTGLTQKSRTPDLLVLIGNWLVLVQVQLVVATTTTKSSSSSSSSSSNNQQKWDDLLPLLQQQSTHYYVLERPLFVIVDVTRGVVPQESRQDIVMVATQILQDNPELAKQKADSLIQQLQEMVSSD